MARVINFANNEVMAGDDEEQAHGARRNGNVGGHGARAPPQPAPERESTKTRAMISLLKDGMKPLDINAADMTNQIWIFRESVERYFAAIGIGDLDDNDPDNEADRVLAVKSAMGPEAAVALIGRDPTEIDTYDKIIDVLTDRFAPSDDDVHTLGLLRQCTMRDDETTKAFVNRVRAVVYRMTSMSNEWKTKHILSTLRMSHKSPKLRELLAEKAPETVQEAEKIAEAFEVRAKDKPVVDRLVGALTGANSSALSVDQVRARGSAMSSGQSSRGIVCHICGGRGHIARVCPTPRNAPAPQTGGTGGNRPSAPASRGFSPRFPGTGFRPRGSSMRVPTNYAGYARYDERAEQLQFDQWQSSYAPEFPPAEEGGTADYSGAMAAEYAPAEHVVLEYGPGFPHRSAPQYLPTHTPASSSSAAEICLLEADLNTSVSTISEWWTPVQSAKGSLHFKVDTGAKGNICSLRDLYRLGYTRHNLVRSNVYLLSFEKRVVQPLGTLLTRVKVNGVWIPFELHVVPRCNSPLLSLRDSVRVGLVQLPPTVLPSRPPEESDYIEEFNAYNQEVVHLEVRDDAEPKQFPPRRVPLALQARTLFELQEMQKNGIIEPVNEPTRWCHPMIVTPKPNGRLRVCMDPRYLNQYLVRAIHPFPDMEEIFTQIRGATVFTKIDLTHGFWNLRLDPASSDLCVFATPWGRFRYLRLPFGVAPAPEVFHRVVADVIRGLPNVVHYIDDILIYAATREEHDSLVREVIRRLRAVGFAICADKCVFAQPTMTFLGHSVSGTCIKPDPLKLEALTCMQPPTNVAELNSFLGSVNYLARYVPRLAHLAEPLRRLQSSKVEFAWTTEQDAAFRAIRLALVESPGLAPFDPGAPVVVATDASHRGLGGVLMQHGRPVVYVARSLTPAESRYAIIEKELLAVSFVLSRCHFYTYGRPIVLQTDHKPLLGLVHADADRLSARLRRLVERLFPYNLQWEYIPGKDNLFPDALSRLSFTSASQPHDVEEAAIFATSDEHKLSALMNGGPVFQNIAHDGQHDHQFMALRQCVRDGWPEKLVKRDVRHHILQPYWAQRAEIRELGPFLLYGSRVCVPRTQHAAALHILHRGHPGVSLMLQRARNLFYWPGISADVHRVVADCRECALTRPSPPPEPLLSSTPATYPGECVAADFFDYNGECYLAFVDAFSNFPFYCRVTSPSSKALITACQQVFLQTGFPRQFASDGGPAFRAQDFADFLAAGSVEHRVSSPRYAQSNGAAERAVQTLKNLRKKNGTPAAFFHAVLLLQNTPRPDTGVSPSQLFLGRVQRTSISPVVTQYTTPWVKRTTDIRHAQQTSARQHDRHARPRTVTWTAGGHAWLRDPDRKPVLVTVLGHGDGPRTVVVRLPSGHVTTRNQRLLFPCLRSTVPEGTPCPPTRGTLPAPAPAPATAPNSSPWPRPPCTPTGSSRAAPTLPRSRPREPRRLTRTGTSTLPAVTFHQQAVFNPAPSVPIVTSSRLAPVPRPAHLNTLSPCNPGPSVISATSSSPGPVPRPTHLTTSRSSFSPVFDPVWSSPRPTVQPPTPPPPAPAAAAAAGRANVLGNSRSGRVIGLSLRAQEAQATGSWNPRVLLPPATTTTRTPSRPLARRAPPLPPPPPTPSPSTTDTSYHSPSSATPPSSPASPSSSRPPSSSRSPSFTPSPTPRLPPRP